MLSAGLNQVKLAALVRRAVETIVAALEATEPVYSKDGQLLGEKPAWNARMKATQQVLDLAGVIPSRNAPTPEKPPAEDKVPEWARPLVAKDVTPDRSTT